jgi:zinc transporter ZupT
MLFNNLLLFAVTLLGGSAPLWLKGVNEKSTNYLLAFSGSFLLSITLLHLLPETFEEVGSGAGILVLAGFFTQMVIQRMTHGVEHGHAHIHIDGHGHVHGATHHEQEHTHSLPLFSIILGLSIHAFMEGLPLGFNYRMDATGSSLYLAVAAHKLPEAMLLTSVVLNVKGKQVAWLILILFSLLTPVAAVLADTMGKTYFFMSSVVTWIIPAVAGAFIHIATTIFYESGTRQHLLTWQKTLAILLGVGIGLTTLLFH